MNDIGYGAYILQGRNEVERLGFDSKRDDINLIIILTQLTCLLEESQLKTLQTNKPQPPAGREDLIFSGLLSFHFGTRLEGIGSLRRVR